MEAQGVFYPFIDNGFQYLYLHMSRSASMWPMLFHSYFGLPPAPCFFFLEFLPCSVLAGAATELVKDDHLLRLSWSRRESAQVNASTLDTEKVMETQGVFYLVPVP